MKRSEVKSQEYNIYINNSILKITYHLQKNGAVNNIGYSALTTKSESFRSEVPISQSKEIPDQGS